jgi:hypothetical protein
MSTKINALMSAVYLAAGITAPAVAAVPVLETLLNDYKVSGVQVVQVDDAGRCVVLATVQVGTEAPAIRPVANSNGDIKLFTDMGAAYPMIKRAKLQAASEVNFFRKPVTPTLGDPVAGLKSQYKSFKSEKAVVDKVKLAIDAKVTAADALGWGASSGTPERAEYDDLLQRRGTVNESIAFCAARITALAAALTAAGIDPATVV